MLCGHTHVIFIGHNNDSSTQDRKKISCMRIDLLLLLLLLIENETNKRKKQNQSFENCGRIFLMQKKTKIRNNRFDYFYPKCRIEFSVDNENFYFFVIYNLCHQITKYYEIKTRNKNKISRINRNVMLSSEKVRFKDNFFSK